MGRELIEAIRRITGTTLSDKVYIFPAEVVSVNEAERTCIVEALGAEERVTIEGVKLMAAVDDGLLLIPSVESTVIVIQNTHGDPYVSLFSEVTKIVSIVGESSIEVTSGKIAINDGKLGGLVKVGALTDKLNAIEQKVNDLISLFNSHTHSGVTSGTSTSGTTPTIVSGNLTQTAQSDIENDKVTHG